MIISNNKSLKELRKKNSISTRSLAKAIGLKSHAAITQFEKGTSMPALDTLVAIAGFFEVTLDYLVGMTDFPQAIPDKTKRLLEQTENPEAFIAILNQISLENLHNPQNHTETPQIIAEMIMGLDEKSMLELYMFLRYLHIRQTLVKTDAISADRI